MNVSKRVAAVAGTFYPAEAPALRAAVSQCLGAVDAAPELERAPKLLIVPHAGFVYSGPVAAHAYAVLARWRQRIRRVVLLGPAHRVALNGLAAPSTRSFETPLGSVPIDREALALLADLPQVRASDTAHALEHSLEVQLPFLQSVLEDFKLVPLVVGRADPEQVAAVLERLWGGDETLIVISSDLSHYLPYEEAQRIDRATVERMLKLDPELDHTQACGATPIAAGLIAARRHALAARLLDLRNSGDTAGDRSRVVGYCAMAFEATVPDCSSDTVQQAADDAALGPALLARARNAIARPLGLRLIPEPAHAALEEKGATFVTLHKHGALRGCIGTLEATRALGEDVALHAWQAAFHDSRFAPLRADEFNELEIEASVLGPAQAMAVASEAEACASLRPGIDGVILRWHGHHATFLPQVWEQLPSPCAFLAALKHKAGLSGEFWAPDLQLSRYQVRKFRE